MSNQDVQFVAEANRRDDLAIIAQAPHLVQAMPIRLHFQSGGYAKGTVLALNSTNLEWQAYNDAGSSGINTAKAILLDQVKEADFPSQTDGVGNNVLTRAAVKGTFFYDNLTGIDANGVTDLGRKFTDALGVNLLVVG